MRIVHLSIQPQVEPNKKAKLSKDKKALMEWVAMWDLKNNARIDKQQKYS